MTTKKSKKQSPLQRAISNQLYRSHERLLEEALEVTPEVTDLMKLREMYPHYDVDKLLRLQRLNMKINAANDFLIEEQSAWLDPSTRPTGGIPYNEELFGKPFASDEENAEDIQNQVYNDNQQEVDYDTTYSSLYSLLHIRFSHRQLGGSYVLILVRHIRPFFILIFTY